MARKKLTADPISDVPAIRDYAERIGAEALNFKRLIVKEYRKGKNYYLERGVVRINPDGSITCSNPAHQPTADESRAIREAMQQVRLPTSVDGSLRAARLQAERIEKELGGTTYLFPRRPSGTIVMVRQRFTTADGQKVHVPWTLWSDGQWRRMEPEQDLPFWKPLQDRGRGMKMVHEGEKAAQFVDSLVNDPSRRRELRDHPWGEELARYEHWGMIGGALAPHRTDYSELLRERPTQVVYVCDNDFPGESALQMVSRCYGESMRGIRFGKEFPASWDMADPLPEKLFSRDEVTGHRRYNGKPLRSLMQPATWATEVVPQPKGRPTILIRRPFLEEWVHSVKPEVYMHRDWPYDMWTLGEFNNKVRPFSHVDDTGRLVKMDDASKAAVIRYDPSRASGLYEENGRFINTHCPTQVVRERGDYSLFTDFMDNLVTDPQDRLELMRWCATLVARPGVKMTYGVLLISEQQGVGKSSLGEKILAPLVGESNVSYPSESEIVDSNYNYWLAHKRLAVVHEIYAGHSSRAYHRLQSVITDRYVTVSKKYVANYELECFVHVYACSNSMRALRFGQEDRRWHLPRITDKKQSTAYWTRLNEWLRYQGGLGKVLHWAEEFLEEHGPVVQGAEAPDSSVKRDVVEDGYSPGQRLAAQTLERVQGVLTSAADEDRRTVEGWRSSGMIINGSADSVPSVIILDTDLVRLVQDQVYQGRYNDKLEKPLTMRKLAKSLGWHVGQQAVSTGMRTWGQEAAGGRIISNDKSLAETSPTQLGGVRGEGNSTRIRPLSLEGFRKM